MKYSKDQQVSKNISVKPPTILAYQPQINFYYPANQMINTLESPISQKMDSAVLSNKRKQPDLSSSHSQANEPKDYRVEIERKFRQSRINQTYAFPRQNLSMHSQNTSLESLRAVGTYNLKNQKRKNDSSSKKHLSIQEILIYFKGNQTDLIGSITKKVESLSKQSRQTQFQAPYLGNTTYRVGEQESNSKPSYRVKTEGNQPEENISISQLKTQNAKLTQQLRDIQMKVKSDTRFNDTYKLPQGNKYTMEPRIPSKSINTKIEMPYMKNKLNTWQYQQAKLSTFSPLNFNQGKNGNFIELYGAVIGSSKPSGLGSQTDRKPQLQFGVTYKQQKPPKLQSDRIQTVPAENDQGYSLQDLVFQYEHLKNKQINLASKHNQITSNVKQGVNRLQLPVQAKLKLGGGSLSPQQQIFQAPNHQRTQTIANERSTRLKTEPTDQMIYQPYKQQTQQSNYYQKGKFNFNYK